MNDLETYLKNWTLHPNMSSSSPLLRRQKTNFLSLKLHLQLLARQSQLPPLPRELRLVPPLNALAKWRKISPTPLEAEALEKKKKKELAQEIKNRKKAEDEFVNTQYKRLLEAEALEKKKKKELEKEKEAKIKQERERSKAVYRQLVEAEKSERKVKKDIKKEK